MTDPIATRLAAGLVSRARSEARLRGYSFAPQCLSDFEDRALEAAQRALARGLGERYARFQLLRGFHEVIHRMVFVARTDPGLAGPVLHEPTLMRALTACGIIFWCDPDKETKHGRT